MKQNRTMGIVWIAVALVLVLILVQGLRRGFPDLTGLHGLAGNKENTARTNLFPGDEIRRISTELKSLSLEIEASDDGNVHVDFLDGAEEFCRLSSGGGKVSVEQGMKSLGKSSCKVRISIPSAWKGDLDLGSVSGSVRLDGITAGLLELEGVSGSATISACTIGSLDMELVSGSVRAEGSFDRVSCETVSGSIRVDFGKAPEGKCKFESASGSVNLVLPHDCGYTLDYSSMSGSFSDEITGASGGKKGTSRNGNGSVPIKVSTMSGSIKVH